MYDKMFSGTSGIQKDIVLKLNPSWILRNKGVCASPKVQFGVHEKLSWVGEGHERYAKLSINSGYDCFYHTPSF